MWPGDRSFNGVNSLLTQAQNLRFVQSVTASPILDVTRMSRGSRYSCEMQTGRIASSANQRLAASSIIEHGTSLNPSQVPYRDNVSERTPVHDSTKKIQRYMGISKTRLQKQQQDSNVLQLDSDGARLFPIQDNTGWNTFQRMVAAVLDRVESSFIASLERKHRLPSTADPDVQLAGNFGPVPERPVQHELEVEGKIPECLDGVYIRNGANPLFEPVAGHHFFDGDGMLHVVRFKQGMASYACRFTRTHRLTEELKVGRAFFPKAIGELHGHSGIARLLLFYTRGLCGLVDMGQGMGVANAGLVFFNGHLLAMSEDDLPYAVKITNAGDLETIGRYDFSGQLTSSMIAHPKLDANTGELFVLSYDVIKKPYLRYFKFSADGRKGPEVTISLSEPTMMHDFAITENFVVIPDQQVVFRLQEMLTGGSPVVHNRNKTPRFGILPKHDTNESRIVWIDVPDCFCFHLWNAWEDGDEIVVIGSCMAPPDSIFNESDQPLKSLLSEIRLNTSTGSSTKRMLASMNLEAGQVNRNYLGRKTQFAYLAIVEPWPKVSGIAKVDIQSPGSQEENVVAKIMYEPGCFGGEPYFVPRTSDPTAPEDDGYVLTFMHNEETGLSELLILDARSTTLKPIASIKLPSRVPYGFHGTFVNSRELDMQKSSLL